MRIVIATGTFAPESSGQATFCENFYSMCEKQSIDCSVITYGNRLRANSLPNIHTVSRSPIRHFVYALRVASTASDSILFAQDLVSSGLPASVTHGERPLVIRLGGDFLWERSINSGWTDVPFSRFYHQSFTLRQRIYLSIYKSVLRKASHIVYNSELQREEYQRFFQLPSNSTSVIENAFDASFAHYSHKRNFEEKHTFIFAARDIPLKNLMTLLKAFSQIHRDDIQLKIFGVSSFLRKEHYYLRDSRIQFNGPVSRQHLSDEILRAAAVVVPSISEFAPNIALEALQLGVPVLITKYNGLPAELRDCCLEIDPFSVLSLMKSMERILNRNEYHSICSAILSVKYRNTWESIFNKYMSLFLGLTS